MIETKDVEPYLGKNEKALLDLWYDDLLTERVGIGYREATGAVSDLRAIFGRWWEAHGIRRAVCDDWNYCQKRKLWDSKALGMASLADFLATNCGMKTDGALAVAVFLVEYAADVLCGCSDTDTAG